MHRSHWPTLGERWRRTFAFLCALCTSAACTDAGLCKRGELDCVCTSDDSCGGGAVCEDGFCVEAAGSKKPPPDPDPDSGPTQTDSGTPTTDPCEADDKETACIGFCEAFCRNEERYCATPDSRCFPDDCLPGGEILGVCLDQCASVDCARNLCEQEQDKRCSNFGYEDDTGFYVSGCFADDPICVHSPATGCSDTCGTLSGQTGGDLADNGVCEDGDQGSVSSDCNPSTDCSDCGVRSCQRPGDSCAGNGDCCGFVNDEAFCVDVPSQGNICLVTCDADNTCPPAFACSSIQGESTSVCAPL